MQPNSTSRTESRRRRERRAGHVRRFRQSGRPAAEEGTGGVRLPAVPLEDEAAAARTRGVARGLLFGRKKLNRYVV
jgi:hypothetical protein